jgi:hypothetical protein
MGKTEKYTNDYLNIVVTEDSDRIHMHWSGKSIDRKPSIFLTPILIKIMKRSVDRDKRMIMDFCDIEYMNSSTITPIIKILERAKRSKVGVTVKYLAHLKWQDLIFSALEIFQTKDKRILIHGNNQNEAI